jgi:flagellar protein FlaG
MSIQNIGGSSSSGNLSPIDPAQKTAETQRTSSAAHEKPATVVPDTTQVKAAMEQLQKAVEQSSNSNLQFSEDKETGKTVIRVTDRESGKLIRQIPSQEVIDLAKSIDQLQGMLLKQKA